ncbi:MAG: hypothetical protein ACREVG_04540, partial [Burkholderiales bacterium]
APWSISFNCAVRSFERRRCSSGVGEIRDAHEKWTRKGNCGTQNPSLLPQFMPISLINMLSA